MPKPKWDNSESDSDIDGYFNDGGGDGFHEPCSDDDDDDNEYDSEKSENEENNNSVGNDDNDNDKSSSKYKKRINSTYNPNDDQTDNDVDEIQKKKDQLFKKEEEEQFDPKNSLLFFNNNNNNNNTSITKKRKKEESEEEESEEEEEKENKKKHKKRKVIVVEEQKYVPQSLEQLGQLFLQNINDEKDLEKPLDSAFLNMRKDYIIKNKIYLGNLLLSTSDIIDLNKITPNNIVDYINNSYDLRMPGNAFNFMQIIKTKSTIKTELIIEAFENTRKFNLDFNTISSQFEINHNDIESLYENSKIWYSSFIKLKNENFNSIPELLANINNPMIVQAIQDYIFSFPQLSIKNNSATSDNNEKEKIEIDF